MACPGKIPETALTRIKVSRIVMIATTILKAHLRTPEIATTFLKARCHAPEITATFLKARRRAPEIATTIRRLRPRTMSITAARLVPEYTEDSPAYNGMSSLHACAMC